MGFWLADMIKDVTSVVTEVAVSPIVGIKEGIEDAVRESDNRNR